MLLQQVLRAHRMFLLHHGTSLADIFVRVGKPNLCNVLRRFWDAFVAKWDVLLHGNPAAEVFSALKLSAGGELGIGVGEEEWGSGEREVLEDFIRRTSGLIDIVVSRFGAGEHRDPQLGGEFQQRKAKGQSPGSSASPKYPEPSDGVIFSGIRAVSRRSVYDISAWMQSLYTDGEQGYGVYDNPSSTRLRKRRKPRSQADNKPRRPPVDIPPSLFSPRPQKLAQPAVRQEEANGKKAIGQNDGPDLENETGFDTTTMMKYLTLGAYGSKWSNSLWKQNGSQNDNKISSERVAVRKDEKKYVPGSKSAQESTNLPTAYYLIGLRGEVESDDELDEVKSGPEQDRSTVPPLQTDEWIRSRTILVERCRATEPGYSSDIDDKTFERVRVVVYIVMEFLSHSTSMRLPFLAITFYVYISFRPKHRIPITAIILQGYPLPARTAATLTPHIHLA